MEERLRCLRIAAGFGLDPIATMQIADAYLAYVRGESATTVAAALEAADIASDLAALGVSMDLSRA
jgi:hypothetical protein